jgi:hypothetical protein
MPPPSTNNGTTGYGVRSGWRIPLFGHNGTINATGTGLTGISFGQSPGTPELTVTANPINRMYAFLWTPSSYAARSVTFFIAPVFVGQLASLYLALDQQTGVYVPVVPSNWLLPPVSIPIAPAPTVAAVFALLPLARRRRGASP